MDSVIIIKWLMHTEHVKTKKAGEKIVSPALETTYSVGFT